jgi:hypothetical protein
MLITPLRLQPGRAFALLTLMAIVAYSLTPFELPDADPERWERVSRFLVMQSWALGGSPLGLIFHFWLFVPIGVAVIAERGGDDWRSALKFLWVVILPVILCIEAYQVLLPGRHAHIADLMAHIAGTLVGAGIGRLFCHLWLRMRRGYVRHEHGVATALLVAGALLVIGVLVVPAMSWLSLDSWPRKYHLLIGNEVGGERPWLGEIQYLAIYDRGVDAQALFASWAGQTRQSMLQDRVMQGALAVYDFSSATGMLGQAGGSVEPPPLIVPHPHE